MMNTIIDIKNLHCGYGNENILNGLDLSIGSGELIGVIGPNGSGKTTLLRALTGILKPVKGQVFLKNKDISSLTSREIARDIAVVTQAIEPVMISISDYVLMGRFPYYSKFQFFEKQKDIDASEKYMKLTDIYNYKNRLMSELSGGERQRAQVARALAQEPLVLLLDEPTSHLDITHQVKVLDLVKRLNRELKFTVIMVIHDLNLAAEYCSKLVMLKNGEIFQHGTPEDVLTYENIESVYETVVIVQKNPLSNRPFIIPVTEEERKKVASISEPK